MSNKTNSIDQTIQTNAKPLVSVILPTYNRAELVCEAIDSVLSQTYTSIEIIVVDDGSKDNTADLLKKYKDKIKYIYQENQGPGNARNRGIEEASGKYIAFLDSDDIWMDFKIEVQVDIIEKLKEVEFLFSDFCIIKDTKEDIHFGLRHWHKQIKPWDEIFLRCDRYSSLDLNMKNTKKDFNIFKGNLYYPLLFDPYVWPSSALVRRNCIDNTIKFAENVFLFEDWEFFAKLSMKNDAAFMNIETFYNRGHYDDVRLTHCSNIKKAENRLRLLNNVWKKDVFFSKKYEYEITEIESEQLLILSKEYLYDLKPKTARKIFSELKEYDSSKSNCQVKILKILAYLPGGAIFFRLLRSLCGLFL